MNNKIFQYLLYVGIGILLIGCNGNIPIYLEHKTYIFNNQTYNTKEDALNAFKVSSRKVLDSIHPREESYPASCKVLLSSDNLLLNHYVSLNRNDDYLIQMSKLKQRYAYDILFKREIFQSLEGEYVDIMNTDMNSNDTDYVIYYNISLDTKRSNNDTNTEVYIKETSSQKIYSINIENLSKLNNILKKRYNSSKKIDKNGWR